MTPAEFADRVELMIRYELDNEIDRVKARRILIRRLKHPELVEELDRNPARIHPKQGGGGYANKVAYAATCARCGRIRAAHDIDGERDDCDGYIGEP